MPSSLLGQSNTDWPKSTLYVQISAWQEPAVGANILEIHAKNINLAPKSPSTRYLEGRIICCKSAMDGHLGDHGRVNRRSI